MDNQAAQALAFLEDAKQAVEQLETAKEQSQSLSQRELRLKKQLTAEEKAVEDEIAATTRKRKEEVSAGYDREISSAQENLRKLKGQKEQAKNAGKKERIQAETAQEKEENRALGEELRTLLKKERVPKLCRGRWFTLVLMPKGIWEHFVVGMIALFLLLILPYLVFCILPAENPLVLSGLHFVAFLMFGGGYLFLTEHVKYKHIDAWREAARLQTSIRQNKKKIRQTTSLINKDSNEEHYDLSDYNYNIAKAEAQVEEIGSRKQEALQTFEAVTRRVIEDEIREGSRQKIEKLQNQIEDNSQELASVKERVSALSIEVTDRYAGRLGKENLRSDALEQIAKQIRNGSATTVTDAVNSFRSSKS
jgi:hypothetical protein